MLFDLRCDTFCSHGPMGRSHIARQGARSDGPQPVATAFEAQPLGISAPEN